MNLDGLFTKTEVVFSEKAKYDTLVLNHRKIEGPGLQRVSKLLDLVRSLAKRDLYAAVTSENNFPTGAGIASSASAFAALAVASSAALELDLEEVQLSRLARRGSGSACRSIPSGFVEWHAGETDEDSYAVSLAASNHWDIDDCIAIVAAGHKPTGSTEGHALAGTSPLQAARVADTPRRLEICRSAIQTKDFASLAQIVEEDSTLMHAVMMTSHPSIYYWEPTTIYIMKSLPQWRAEGVQAAFTIDAGANVHVLCPSGHTEMVKTLLQRVPGVTQVMVAHAGGGTHLV